VHPRIELNKTVRPGGHIDIQELCRRFFPDDPLLEKYLIAPKREADLSILPFCASFIKHHWDEIFELQWVKKRNS
jgi:hypothetical protein